MGRLALAGRVLRWRHDIIDRRRALAANDQHRGIPQDSNGNPMRELVPLSSNRSIPEKYRIIQ